MDGAVSQGAATQTEHEDHHQAEVRHTPKQLSVAVAGKTRTPDTLPFCLQGDYRTGHFIAVAIVDGRLEFRFNMGTEPGGHIR